MATSSPRKLNWSTNINDGILSINLHGVFDIEAYYDFHELMMSINRGDTIEFCAVDMSGVINISGAGAIFLLTLKRELNIAILQILNATSDIKVALSRIDREKNNFHLC